MIPRTAVLLAGIVLASLAVPQPHARAHDTDGFEVVSFVTVPGATDMDWTPDGRMLVTAKDGRLRVVDGDVLLPTPALDIGSIICDDVERGLVGLTVHPEFADNGWVYLYYTYAKHGNCGQSGIDGPANRASRFTMVGNVLDPSSERVLFETPELFKSNHNSGYMEFGADGYLYVSVGDGSAPRWLERPQDPRYLSGKILRITDDGDIPPGNPFTGPDSADCSADGRIPDGSTATECQQIFAMGLRNPFRLAFDPNAEGTRFFINDVGHTLWEEINEGQAGANYGWPTREGPCQFGSQTECAVPSGMVDPIHWYLHDGGAAITGGAFVPDGLWPSAFDGTYIYGDYVEEQLYVMEPGGADCRTCTPPTSPFLGDEFIDDANSIIGLRFGPWGGSQALYAMFGSQIHRIAYTGDANRTPVARATADPVSGDLPLTVNFVGSNSSDPDDDPLSYTWDFGDGFGSTLADPSHDYTVAGTYDVTLTVDDGEGATSVATLRIDPGNNPPAVTIDSPTIGTEFAVGDLITLTGTAIDPEDGALGDSQLSWEVLLHHNTHVHPFLTPTIGNNIVVEAPAPEDIFAADDSYLEIILTATDAQGVAATVTRDVQPHKVNLTFGSVPSGLDVIVDGFVFTMPQTVVSWEAAELSVEAPVQTLGGTTYGWIEWSQGGEASQILTVPAVDSSYTATFGDPMISPGSANVIEGDEGTATIEVPVTLSHASDEAISVDWSTLDPGQSGIASAGIDYVADSGSITFAPGETSATVTVTVVGDTIDEPPFLLGGEWGLLQFTNPSPNARLDLTFFGLGVFIIEDDDPPPTIVPGVVGVVEGDVGEQIVELPVTLSNPSATEVTVDWTTLSGGDAGVATAGADFLADAGSLTFAPGETARMVSLTILGDTVAEPPAYLGEWALVSFDNASPNAVIDLGFYGLGIVVIIDDDAP